MYKFMIILEKVDTGYSAFSPDIPGCVATGSTKEETEQNMYNAIEMHIEGLIEDDLPIPEASTISEYILLNERTVNAV